MRRVVILALAACLVISLGASPAPAASREVSAARASASLCVNIGIVRVCRRGSRICTTTYVGGLAVTRCRAARQLNMRRLEGLILDGIEAQAGIPMRSVRCPATRTARAGDVFYCTAQARNGATARVRVVQRDNNGNVRYHVM